LYIKIKASTEKRRQAYAHRAALIELAVLKENKLHKANKPTHNYIMTLLR